MAIAVRFYFLALYSRYIFAPHGNVLTLFWKVLRGLFNVSFTVQSIRSPLTLQF